MDLLGLDESTEKNNQNQPPKDDSNPLDLLLGGDASNKEEEKAIDNVLAQVYEKTAEVAER